MINLSLFFVSDLDIFNRFPMSSDPSLGFWIRTNPFFLQAEEKGLLWPDPLLKCKGFHLSKIFVTKRYKKRVGRYQHVLGKKVACVQKPGWSVKDFKN